MTVWSVGAPGDAGRADTNTEKRRPEDTDSGGQRSGVTSDHVSGQPPIMVASSGPGASQSPAARDILLLRPRQLPTERGAAEPGEERRDIRHVPAVSAADRGR